MDFGKVTQISHIDFSLPAAPIATQTVLAQYTPTTQPQVYIGCPIWSQRGWVGRLYPPTATSQDYLQHYAQQFNTIELNSTHYSLPAPDLLQRWRQQVPAGFRFCPKVLQNISHHQLPVEQAQADTEQFSYFLYAIGEHLGMPFLQLPPYFSVEHLPALHTFLQQYPQDLPLAFEFRHTSWFQSDALDTAAELLQNYHKSTVITDVAGRRDVLHMRLTTPIAVIRFVGNGLHPTDYKRIDMWVTQLQQWFSQGLQTVYFFVHEPDNLLAPELADYLIQQLNQHCQLNLPRVQWQAAPEQQSLF